MARGNERLADLVRMLNLLPYFTAHPERTVMEAARDLGREPEDIMDDLNRLWCCGLPGLMPGDLVDLDHNYRRVRIANAQGMDRPLRLTTTEAAALLLALENLEATPGLVDKSAVLSAAAKLRGIMGDSVSAVVDAVAGDIDTGHAEVIRAAMDQGHQLEFDYFSQSTYTSAHRTVSPAHVFTQDGNTYLTAWDHEAKGHRTFRLDRMSVLTATDTPADPHLGSLNFNAKDPFKFHSTRRLAEVLVAPDYAWIASYVPLKLRGQVEEGAFANWYEGSLPVGSEEWLIRFVLGSEGKVRIMEPTRLAKLVAERAGLGLTAYDELMDT